MSSRNWTILGLAVLLFLLAFWGASNYGDCK